MASILPPGTAAPDFSLNVTPDQQLSLSELRGKPVIQKYGAELIGISVDGAWCHAAYAKDHNLHFPLAADFEPKGAVARAYGAYREKEGFCERALFVIDKDGVITWSYCSPVAVNPGADGILEALEELGAPV